MTPAVAAAKKAGIAFTLHEYPHDPNTTAYGEEAAAALGIPTARVFKTLLTRLEGQGKGFAVCIVPVAGQLDLKAAGRVLGVKKLSMAEAADAERVTGYLVGGISPLGQKKRLPTLLDASALDFPSIFVSAGRRGLEIELSPDDLLKLCQGRSISIRKAV